MRLATHHRHVIYFYFSFVCSTVPQRVPYVFTSAKPDNQKNSKQLLTCCKAFNIPYMYILSLLSDIVNRNII